MVVLEYGGRYINGSIRPLFDSPEYTSIDIVPGDGVDVVADAATYTPTKVPDTIVCCEVLEHTDAWADIVKQAGSTLDPENGILILTCATHGRQPHSAVDGGALRGGEYYGNVDPMECTAVLDMAGFQYYEVNAIENGDLQVIAWKKSKE
jgi:hypothetical protein